MCSFLVNIAIVHTTLTLRTIVSAELGARCVAALEAPGTASKDLLAVVRFAFPMVVMECIRNVVREPCATSHGWLVGREMRPRCGPVHCARKMRRSLLFRTVCWTKYAAIQFDDINKTCVIADVSLTQRQRWREYTTTVVARAQPNLRPAARADKLHTVPRFSPPQ